MLFSHAGRRKSRRNREPNGRNQGKLPSVLTPVQRSPSVGVSEGIDVLFVLALGVLISIGLIMMYSTLAGGDQGKGLLKLSGGLAMGLVLLYITATMPVRVWSKITPYLLVGCILALFFLLIPGNPLAVMRHGATRWYNLPGGNTIQPSEYTKLIFILFAAHFLDRASTQMNRGVRQSWVVFLGVLCMLCGLIYKEPDLGTTLVLAGTAFCMLLAAGINGRILLVGAVTAGILVLALAWSTEHQRARLLAWWNPWQEEYRMEGGYQVIRSWMAMARGSWMGAGLGQSTQKMENRLPESDTDFIFAIVAEEMGLLRAVGVIATFGLLVWRGYTIAARAPDRYSSLLVSGITSWVAVQSCLNIAVATGLVPNTGVPLPFISSGLSSFTALMAGAGIVIGISGRTRRLPARASER